MTTREEWLGAVQEHPDSVTEDVETARLVLTFETLPPELVSSDRIKRLVDLGVMTVQPNGNYLPIYVKVVGSQGFTNPITEFT